MRQLFVIALLTIGNPVLAANQFDFDEDTHLSVGLGTIISYQSIENAAPIGDSRLDDFKLNSARLIVNGQFNKSLKGMFRTERISSTSQTEVIDANLQFEIAPNLTIWAGRFLSPSDRANMAGPYNSMGGGFWAGVSARYAANGGNIGRDDGLAIVGRALDQRLHYSIGAFDGNNIFRFTNVGAHSKAPSSKDKLMYAGRLQYDFWDIESGYYGTANYFGKKNILSVGMSGRFKEDGAVSSMSSVGDYSSYSFDLLFEKKDIGPGAVSMEAAYYNYDTDDIFLGEQGKAYLAGTGYIFNKKVGWGQFMPFVRYQKFAADGLTNSSSLNTPMDLNRTKTEYGLNYVIEPYSAMITIMYSDSKITGSKSVDAINLVMQFQY